MEARPVVEKVRRPSMVPLSLVVLGYSSGVPSSYRVEGLHGQQAAQIRMRFRREKEYWLVQRKPMAFRGHFPTAEDALKFLQAAVDAEHRQS